MHNMGLKRSAEYLKEMYFYLLIQGFIKKYPYRNMDLPHISQFNTAAFVYFMHVLFNNFFCHRTFLIFCERHLDIA